MEGIQLLRKDEFDDKTIEIEDSIIEIDDKIAQFGSITDILGVKNDGTQDISSLVSSYALGKDELSLYFPSGKYRWDNYTKLVNKKIKLIGDNAVIELYGSGANLDIGDTVTKTTEQFTVQGIDFINRRPKTGTGASAIVIGDCVKVFMRDVNIYGMEQYGIQLRRENGNIGKVVLDNVNIFDNAGNLTSTTSIALETRANSGDGKIFSIKMSNCYFEVVDKFTNSSNNIVNVQSNGSNACKLQACDEIEMTNVTFKGGRENGTLTFAYNTKKVKMTNVVCKTDMLISKGLTISNCPELELTAINCDMGVDNFVQSIGINDSVKSAQFTNCKLNRVSKVSGYPQNFSFNECIFQVTSTLALSFDHCHFNNCKISNDSVVKNVLVGGSNNRITNFSGINLLEITGSYNELINVKAVQLRPNIEASRNTLDGCRFESPDRPMVVLTSTIRDWLIKNTAFVKTGTDSLTFVSLQGSRIKFTSCDFIQITKTTPVANAFSLNDATDAVIIESDNRFDANFAGDKYSIGSGSTVVRYKIGDTKNNNGTLQMWNGTAFVNINTAP